MSPIVLLEELKKFVEENTKDIILATRPVKNKVYSEDSKKKPPHRKKKSPKVYLMRLPDKDAETNLIPYIVLQYLTGKDEQPPGEPPYSTCTIRIVAATYSEDAGEGAKDLLNVLTRIRIALLKSGGVGQFLLCKPLENIVYPDETNPYYLGEMLTIWEIPIIQREVTLYV
ncbi:MAG: hypothetical protein FWH05_08695 [Oscillospiraceae bacterium]|nr:hypothetical protein [Oscillospiraceae bacterium]